VITVSHSSAIASASAPAGHVVAFDPPIGLIVSFARFIMGGSGVWHDVGNSFACGNISKTL